MQLRNRLVVYRGKKDSKRKTDDETGHAAMEQKLAELRRQRKEKASETRNASNAGKKKRVAKLISELEQFDMQIDDIKTELSKPREPDAQKKQKSVVYRGKKDKKKPKAEKKEKSQAAKKAKFTEKDLMQKIETNRNTRKDEELYESVGEKMKSWKDRKNPHKDLDDLLLVAEGRKRRTCN